MSSGASDDPGSEGPTPELLRLLDELVARCHRGEPVRAEELVASFPSLAGRITMAFTITGEGAVSEARIEADTMGNPAVGECLARRLRQMKFPKSECASVAVSYPFIFVKTN